MLFFPGFYFQSLKEKNLSTALELSHSLTMLCMCVTTTQWASSYVKGNSGCPFKEQGWKFFVSSILFYLSLVQAIKKWNCLFANVPENFFVMVQGWMRPKISKRYQNGMIKHSFVINLQNMLLLFSSVTLCQSLFLSPT